MSERKHRQGAEFGMAVRRQALTRAQGRCEHPLGCTDINNGRLDHITSCLIGSYLGMSRATLRSLDNAQLLCDFHEAEKTLILEPAALEAIYHRMGLMAGHRRAA